MHAEVISDEPQVEQKPKKHSMTLVHQVLEVPYQKVGNHRIIVLAAPLSVFYYSAFVSLPELDEL